MTFDTWNFLTGVGNCTNKTNSTKKRKRGEGRRGCEEGISEQQKLFLCTAMVGSVTLGVGSGRGEGQEHD